jgi:translation initiation factor IF-1
VGFDQAVTDGRDKLEPSRDREGASTALVATVLEELPSLIYKVELEKSRQVVLAHTVGTVKRNFVRLLPGDRVEVDLASHDLTRGRILRKIGS